MQYSTSEIKRANIKIFLGLAALIFMPLAGILFGTLLNIYGFSNGFIVGLILGFIIGGVLFFLSIRSYVDNWKLKREFIRYVALYCIVLLVKQLGFGNTIGWTAFVICYLSIPMNLALRIILQMSQENKRQNGTDLFLTNDEESASAKKKKEFKVYLFMFAICVLILPISYFSYKLSGKPATSEKTQEIFESMHPTCTVNNITFEIESEWEPLDGYDGMYITKDQRVIYGLQGVSQLGSFTPKEFFEELKEFYSQDYTILKHTSYTVARGYSPDGVPLYKGEIRMIDNNGVYYDTAVLIVPDKNIVLTFSAQSTQELQSDATLERMSRTTTFQIGDQDYISGNTFLMNDNSELCLKEDGSFRYYKSEDDHENQYYIGTYEVFYGQAAFNKLESLSKYNLTMEELEHILSLNMNGYVLGDSSLGDILYALEPDMTDKRTKYQICKDTFYAVILHNYRLVSSPNDETEMGHDTLYVGYYIPELEIADMRNVDAASYTRWTYKKQKTGS